MSCVRVWMTPGPPAHDTASNVPKSRSWVKTTYQCAQVMMTASVALGFPTVDQ